MNVNRYHLCLLGVVVLGATAMLLVGSWFCYTSSFDTATVGLMAVNILQGDRPLFFYGQPYFGALEAYLAAFYLGCFGFSEFVISLSPITFTLFWLLFTYLLFCRIHSKQSGLVAAATVAFPGYYVFWYSIATYGGYSAILCIGTALLWLALRVLQEQPEGAWLFFQCIVLGVFMALGIWIHALIVPYVAIAAVMLILFLWQRKFSFTVFCGISLTAVIGIAGFLPNYIETGGILGGALDGAGIKTSAIFYLQAIQNLFVVDIYELIVWNFVHIFESQSLRFIIEYGGITIVMVGCFLGIVALLDRNNIFSRKKYYLVPLSFSLLFLFMYSQHHMAIVKAPRYAITFWLMLLCVIWSITVTWQKQKMLRLLSTVLFFVWLAYQVIGTIFFISGNSVAVREEQEIMRAVVREALKKNLTGVVTLGDTKFGYKAQKLSMFSENKIHFANAGLERYKENAQYTERDPKKGFLTTIEYKDALQRRLKGAQVRYKLSQIGKYYLFYDLDTESSVSRDVIPSSEISFISSKESREIDGNLLIDRSQDIGISLVDGEKNTVTFDTGRQRLLTGIWLFGSQTSAIPKWQGTAQFEVYVSPDDQQYDKVYTSSPDAVNIFHAGSHVYLDGIRNKMEAMFSPVAARFIKIIFLKQSNTPVTELFVFQKSTRKQSKVTNDLQSIQDIIDKHDLGFVLADRWVSANLRELYKDTDKAEIALPRYSLKYKRSFLRYVVNATQGQAIVCDISVADECDGILRGEYGDTVIASRTDLNEYSVFILRDPIHKISLSNPSALLWNGHIPLKTHNMELIAFHLYSKGLPVWKTDYMKNRGFYHDSWSKGNGELFGLNYNINSERDNILLVYTSGWRPGTVKDVGVRIVVNNGVELQFLRKENDVYFFSLPPKDMFLDKLQILSSTFVPPGPDLRTLGLDVRRIEIHE